MLLNDGPSALEAREYCGRILNQDYSAALKERVIAWIDAFREMEQAGVPVMSYIAAWKEAENVMWYEFSSERLCELLRCESGEVAEVLRQSVLDRREYRYADLGDEVQEEVITRQELERFRQGLRDSVRQRGGVEAVYKVVEGRRTLWLKDRAVIRTFAEDGILVALGALTDVTKEMEQKDLLQKIGYFDELTRLPKRNIMQTLLEMSFGQMRKKLIHNFSFLLLALDDFAGLRARLGAEAADRVLAEVAELLSVSKRREDEIGRFGGEEFYALSHGGLESGRELAERLRRRVAQTPFAAADGTPLSLTLSVGVVEATELA
ncbi:MAG TPA: diguanylate cyclase, partial [Desulfurivibrionaceae bacterium]|nr:diguanylate cyclase [Desulfurivibrionaceae bacterium]